MKTQKPKQNASEPKNLSKIADHKDTYDGDRNPNRRRDDSFKAVEGGLLNFNDVY